MLTGHASHQIGLDADIWFTPMPDRRLTPREREELSATSMLTPDSLAVNSDVWTPAHVQIVKRAASYREVDRVFVHPAIKKALCETAGDDRRWLSKVRPIWGTTTTSTSAWTVRPGRRRARRRPRCPVTTVAARS